MLYLHLILNIALSSLKAAKSDIWVLGDFVFIISSVKRRVVACKKNVAYSCKKILHVSRIVSLNLKKNDKNLIAVIREKSFVRVL